MSTTWGLAVVVAVAVSVLAARPAEACSTSCWPGYLVPADGAVVPANLGGLIWRPVRPEGAALVEAVSIVRGDAPGTPLGFSAGPLDNGDVMLVLDEALVEGQRYTIVDSNTCAGVSGPRSVFTAGPAAPLPATLGTLQATAERQATAMVATADGGCSVEVELASATVELVPSAEAAPWRDVLQFETFVDGTRWWPATSWISPPAPGASWRGRGRDNVYAVCATAGIQTAARSLAEGLHQVELRATLPLTAVSLATPTVAVNLDCELSGGGDGGDSGVSGGCGGCAAAGGGSPGWLALALALVLAATLRRP